MTLRIACIVILGFALSACQHSAHSERVKVSDLFQVSTENISFPVDNEEGVRAATDWMRQDTPTSAQLACDETPRCQDLQAYMEQNAIPYERVQGDDWLLKLSYQRVTARECTSGFGCSTARNTVQMVSDYAQFFNPALSGTTDAAGVISAMPVQK